MGIVFIKKVIINTVILIFKPDGTHLGGLLELKEYLLDATARTKYNNSFQEGTMAEQEFANLRQDNFIRRATRTEDMNEHWDVLDKEFGKVDIKAGKRKYRGGPVDYSIHWWEFKNVTGKPGWGTPNKEKRFIAFRLEDKFILVDPNK